MPILPLAGAALALGATAAGARRLLDERRADATWARLAALADPAPPRFDPAMADGLPDPARRWLCHAIAPGTRLSRVAEIGIEGAIGLGTRDAPGYRPFRARQILAPPHGFVWRPTLPGALPMGGSDGCTPDAAWTRFWLFGLVPVVRAADTPDLLRSARARAVAEAALWTPASLLPDFGARWEAVDDHRARVTLPGADDIPVTIEVDEAGRLLGNRLARWSDANPARVFRLQPFGGTVREEGRFGGFTLAARVEAGNLIGTPDWFPFYRARVIDIRHL